MQIVLTQAEFKKLQKKIKNLKAENSELKKKVQELISTLFLQTIHFKSFEPSTFSLLNRPLSVFWTVQFKSFEPSSLSLLNRPVLVFWTVQFDTLPKFKNSEKNTPKKYKCEYPGCDWEGSRGGRSKHTRSKHPSPETNSTPAPSPAPSPAEPSASTASPVAARLRGSSLALTGTLMDEFGSRYRGSFRLNDLDQPMNPIFESTRIDQSETLSTESSYSGGSDSGDPTYLPY